MTVSETDVARVSAPLLPRIVSVDVPVGVVDVVVTVIVEVPPPVRDAGTNVA